MCLFGIKAMLNRLSLIKWHVGIKSDCLEDINTSILIRSGSGTYSRIRCSSSSSSCCCCLEKKVVLVKVIVVVEGIIDVVLVVVVL